METNTAAPRPGLYDAALDQIIHAAAEVFNVLPSDIDGRSRIAQICDARLAVYVVARKGEIPPHAILARMKRDRSIASHYHKTAAELAQTNPAFAKKIQRVEAKCS